MTTLAPGIHAGIALRCSALPRILSCPASRVPPAIEIAGDTDDSRLGDVAHMLMAKLVSGVDRAEYDADLEGTARRWDVDAKDLSILYHGGRKLWAQFEDVIEVLETEAELSGDVLPDVHLTGHADLIGMADEALIVADWKSQEGGRNPKDQLLGYAALAVAARKQNRPVKVIAFYLRDGVADVRDVTTDDLTDFLKRLADAVAHPERFNPTPANCEYCPRRHECPARVALVHSSLAALAVGAQSTALTPAECGDLYLKVQMVEKLCSAARDAIRSKVAELGALPTGDGREVVLVDETRESIDASAAWEPLVDEIGFEALAGALIVSKERVTKAIGDGAPKGQKGKAIQAFLDKLRESGAIRETAFTKLAVRKAQAAHGIPCEAQKVEV